MTSNTGTTLTSLDFTSMDIFFLNGKGRWQKDIATYIINRPRGQFSENLQKKCVFSKTKKSQWLNLKHFEGARSSRQFIIYHYFYDKLKNILPTEDTEFLNVCTNTKHCKNCKKLPWELVGCQGVKVFLLKDVIITISVTTVILLLSQFEFLSFFVTIQFF